jgi:hypothetical protein
MRRPLLPRALPLLLLLAGCASLRRIEGPAAGFTETRPAPDVFKIVYPQDSRTHSARSHDLALLRASELALQNGFSHFTVLPEPKAGLTIRGDRAKPNGAFAFDAAFLLAEIRKKYGIQPAATPGAQPARPGLESLRRLFAGLQDGQRLRLATPRVPPNEYTFIDYYAKDDTVALRPDGDGMPNGRIFFLQDIVSVELMGSEPPEP